MLALCGYLLNFTALFLHGLRLKVYACVVRIIWKQDYVENLEFSQMDLTLKARNHLLLSFQGVKWERGDVLIKVLMTNAI